jgi:uncharacterized protein YggE
MGEENTVSSNNSENKRSDSVSLRLNFRWISLALLFVVLIMLALWRPWQAKVSDQSRTITVTGEAQLKTEPDEYLFSPSYDFKEANKDTALKEVTAKQTDVVAGLKKLGVADSAIKADSSGYNYNYYFDDSSNTYNYTLSLTVTLTDKTLVQKVQDYLVTTSPSGNVSPNAQFSNAKQKSLDNQLRDVATKDARAKADQSAKNLGFEVGAVKSVEDGASSGGSFCRNGIVCPLSVATDSAGAEGKATASLPVQAGQNEQNYSVTVVYYVK